MDDDDELYKILNDHSKSTDSKISKLRHRADNILKNVEIELKCCHKVDKSHITRLKEKRDKIAKLKASVDADETIAEIKNKILLKRKADVSSDIVRLKHVLSAAEELVAFEYKLNKKCDSLVDQAEHFNEMSTLLAKFEESKMKSLKLVQSYSNRVKILNPINSLVNIWNECVTIRNDMIRVAPDAGEAVRGFVVLGRLDHFLNEVFTCTLGIISRMGAISFESETFKIIETDSASSIEDISSISKFLKYLNEIGISMGPEQSSQFETLVLDKFLTPAIPSDSNNSTDVDILIREIKDLSTELEIKFCKIDQFADHLASLIKNAKLSKSLGEGRKIVTRSGELSTTVIPESDSSLNPVCSTSLSLSESTVASLELKFQNIKCPISTKCADIWKLMATEISAAHLLSNIYILFIPKLHKKEICENVESYCIFSNDIQWLIGGLARLSLSKTVEKGPKFANLNNINQLKLQHARFQRLHVENFQNQQRELIGEKLKLFDSIENQENFEELMIVVSDIVAHFNKTKLELSQYLPTVALHNMLSSIAINTINIICNHILSLADISVDSCTPTDMILNKLADMNGYDQTVAEDIRYLLRSSLSEIVGMWKTGETKLAAGQVRSMIRALFSNTDHRSNALSVIA